LEKQLGNSEVLCRIVCSSVPKITNDPKVIRLRKKLKKQYGITPKIKENNLDDVL